MKVVVVAGTYCGVGVTSVATGIMDALRRRGLRVQGFKVGPGFNDSKLVEAATGRMAVNLDPWMVPKEHILNCVHRYAAESDVALVDGFQGLFDGRAATQDSQEWTTAELAKLLGAPVMLVVDAAPLGQSAAAIVKGFESFDKRCRVAGVVLNRVSSVEHANLLEKALQKGGVKAPVLGALPLSEDVMGLEEWRWALHLPNLTMTPEKYVGVLGDLVAEGLSLDKILDISGACKMPRCPELNLTISILPANPVKIAVAKDEAFSFYYHENFVMLEACGAELVFFSPLQDKALPSGISALYFGGGHPETYAERLAQNKSLLTSIRAFADAGGIVYAEGGGLLYLSKSVQNTGEFPHELVGLFPFRTRMAPEVIWQSGYVEVEVLPGSSVFPARQRIWGHVSHRSQVVEEIVRSAFGSVHTDCDGYSFAYCLHPQGKDAEVALEGYSWKNVVASYVHLQFASSQEAASALVAKAQEVEVEKVFDAVSEAVKAATAPGGTPAIKRTSSMDLLSPQTSQMPRSASCDVIDKNGHTSKKSNPAAEQMKLHRYSTDSSQHTWKTLTGLWNSTIFGDQVNTVKGKKDESTGNKIKCMGYEPDRAMRSNSSLASTTGRGISVDENPNSSCMDHLSPRAQSAIKRRINEKIVSLSNAGTEVVFSLGLDNRLVGVTNLCSYPRDAIKGRTVVARTRFDTSRLDKGRLEMKLKDFWCRKESAFEINEEYLRSVQPGLVLVDEGGDPDRETVDKLFRPCDGSIGGLRPSNSTVILSLRCHRLSEVMNFMLSVGSATGLLDRAQLVVDTLRGRIARVGSLVSASLPRERVVVLTGLNPLVVGGYWIPEMVTLAGGVAEGNHPGKSHQRISWQDLRDLEPEVLILAASTWEETKLELAQLASLPGWWSLPAMKTGHLYVCSHELFTIPGPRLVDGTELLARILHPSAAGQYGKKGMAMSCTLRNGRRCRAMNLARQFCALL